MGLLIILGLMSLGGIAFYLLLTPEVAGKLFTFDGSLGPDKRGLLELAKLVMLTGSLFLFSLSLFALFMLRQNKLTEPFSKLKTCPLYTYENEISLIKIDYLSYFTSKWRYFLSFYALSGHSSPMIPKMRHQNYFFNRLCRYFWFGQVKIL